MALEPGSKLGFHEIVGPLGAGGMGEVYRARDTRLGREVAIKVLPAEVARDPERLSRFQREATLLASLNHPHIASIYGLDESDGNPFLVLELVEGEDLAERLRRGPLPAGEVVEIALQMAEALEEAHEKGIVHRDLKPANVKLTPEGQVKVLDFGLAEAWEPAPGEVNDLTSSPTLSAQMTAAGVILGTAAYMSPEQARGKPVDKRTDVGFRRSLESTRSRARRSTTIRGTCPTAAARSSRSTSRTGHPDSGSWISTAARSPGYLSRARPPPMWRAAISSSARGRR